VLLELNFLIRTGRIHVKDTGLSFEKLGEAPAVYVQRGALEAGPEGLLG